MKLNELYNNDEFVMVGFFDDVEYSVVIECLEEGMGTLSFGKSKGGKLASAGLQAMGNPKLAGFATAMAINAISQYNKNKRNITRFFAKNRKDEDFYDKVVDDLMKSGNYRKAKTKRINGGKLWELERIAS